MSANLNEKVQNYFISTVYPGTASTNLTSNLGKYLRESALSATAAWTALLKLAAGS